MCQHEKALKRGMYLDQRSQSVTCQIKSHKVIINEPTKIRARDNSANREKVVGVFSKVSHEKSIQAKEDCLAQKSFGEDIIY